MLIWLKKDYRLAVVIYQSMWSEEITIWKKKKDAKGSYAWEQFQVVWDDNGEEVFGVVCCANFKNCFIYKKLIDGQVRSMGTKNLLDHLKHCMASRGTESHIGNNAC